MAINFVPNTLGIAVSGAAGAAGAATQLTLKAADSFQAGDPVFMDWKTGEVLNQNKTPVSMSLTAGPVMNYMHVPGAGGGTATDTQTASASMTLADGSMLLFSGTKYGTQSTIATTLILQKLTPQGAFVSRVHVYPSVSGVMTAYRNLCMALLSNGNIFVAYYGGQSAYALYAIYTQNLQLVASGTISASGVSPYHIQPTSNGGALVFTGGGIHLITAAGVVSVVVSVGGATLCSSDEVNDNSAVIDNGACAGRIKYAPVPISNGGFGYIYGSGAGTFYAQINADGTLRTAPITLTATASGGMIKVAVSPATGNIMWLSAAASLFGIVSDTGAIVKAQTAMTNYSSIVNNGGSSRLVVDANGNFLLLTFTGGAALWYMQYFTPAGGVLFGGSTQVMASNNGANVGVCSISKLSTGTLLVDSNYPSFTFRYAFISLAGVITTGVLQDFGQGQNGSLLRSFVLNDVVYGVCLTGGAANASSTSDLVAFSFTSAGVLNLSPTFVGTSLLTQGQGAADLQLVLDASQKSFHALALSYNGLTTVVSTYDLNLRYAQSFTVPFSLVFCKLRAYAQGILCVDIGAGWLANALGLTVGLFLKPRSTVLLGVAAASATEGSALIVNTKGVYPVSPAWKYAAQTFDQSANNPPGNAGSINSGFLNLKGL